MLKTVSSVGPRPVRVALIGCGRISANHFRSIASLHNDFELVAVCDIQQSRLDQAKQFLLDCEKEFPGATFSPKTYTDYSSLLKDANENKIAIDIVVLTTPSGLHSSQAVAAARNGLHVCSEKPMATRWDDGKAMVRACDEAGVHLFVVKQNRFNSTLQLVKRQLDLGRFGQLAMVSVNVFWQRPQRYYDQDAWRGTWEFDGGALMNQASHYIDLLDWLVGPVQSVSASIATLGRKIEAEDTAALQLRWRNGALGTMSVTMLTYPKNLEGSITILGETGSVKIGGPAVNKIELWEFADSTPDDDLVETASYETTSVYGFGHPPYYKNMLETLQGKSLPFCDGREGLKSLELLSASYLSARDSKVVNLPLEL